jgi:hypothetical protein
MSDIQRINTSEAAIILGTSAKQVRRMLREGFIAGEQVCRDWLINPEDLGDVQKERSGRQTAREGITYQA